MDISYKVVKLTNGDDIVCEVFPHVDDKYIIGTPLKMQVYTDETHVESLHLTAWIAPFTERKTFEIKESHVIIITDASAGLTSYYKNIIRRRTELKLSDELEEWGDTNNKDDHNEVFDGPKDSSKPSLH